MLVPGDVAGGLLLPGGGQPGDRVERLAGADGVLEAGQEPVGERPGREGLAVRPAGDGTPDPPPALGGVADLLDVAIRCGSYQYYMALASRNCRTIRHVTT
jgi:hypothetical protein